MKKGNKKKSKKKKTSEGNNKDPLVNDRKVIKYLQTWKHNRNEWKFEKVKQIRLVSGMLDTDKVPEDVFPVFMEYMESSKGKIRETVITKATEVVEELDNWLSLSEEEKKTLNKPDIDKYNRARNILQTLQ